VGYSNPSDIPVEWWWHYIMDAELKQALVDMETRIYQHVDERLENTETKLLTAFHNWAQTYEVRARGTVTVVREFEERLGFVEERLNKLERARNGQTNPGGPKS
jgi:hypothetical protein